MRSVLVFMMVFLAVAGRTFGDAALEPLPESDEFSKAASLSQWKVFGKNEGWPERIEKLDINQTLAGHLFLEPKHGGWWNGFHGSLLYRDLKGDFLVVTKLTVKGRNTPLPAVAWNRAGILVRKPGDLSLERSARFENFVHIMTGVNGAKQFVVYSGDSQDSQYQFSSIPDPSQKESIAVELAMLRVGEVFAVFYRYQTPGWRILRRVSRSAMGDTPLQVGLTACAEPYDKRGVWLNSAYSNFDYNKEVLPSALPVDTLAYVDYFRFYDPGLSAADRAAVLENKLTYDELTDKLNLWVGAAR